MTCTVTWVFLVDMSGDTYEDFAQRVGLIASSERADWDINDVFNDSTTQEVNWHRHGLTWLLITTTRILKVETASK